MGAAQHSERENGHGAFNRGNNPRKKGKVVGLKGWGGVHPYFHGEGGGGEGVNFCDKGKKRWLCGQKKEGRKDRSVASIERLAPTKKKKVRQFRVPKERGGKRAMKDNNSEMEIRTSYRSMENGGGDWVCQSQSAVGPLQRAKKKDGLSTKKFLRGKKGAYQTRRVTQGGEKINKGAQGTEEEDGEGEDEGKVWR